MDFPIIDRVFGMEDGYVLDFTNRTFAEFFSSSISPNTRVGILDQFYPT